ncbi:putative esterase [Sphaerochaeta pleomorpha str. Grapes]|uniref:Putative esterase n=1 Tax=Sphaerochaeta pleomorpha (strain ATCC BAA-1885 / DSM 22778 / Grapes) TaxID=158190 RepID=G8QSD3_SPHPG|nr:alpha/beta hydrolase family protein [Sphaerochaeta pleomorpha]AEV30063.1 putative esterase [Sphaerochaeta pleomorpha str. Grapes]
MILQGSFFSTYLEMETGLSIYLPNKALGSQAHKVIYLLHGLCGNNADWLNYTMLPVFAERYDAIFIMGEVGRSFYTDMQYGQKYFSYYAKELPQVVKNVFNISAKREDTFAIGASMGGYGALKLAFSNPGEYGGCAAFSPACLFLKEGLGIMENNTSEQNNQLFGKQLVQDFQAIFGQDFCSKPEFELTELAQRAFLKGESPSLYLSCGTEDSFLEENRRFNNVLHTMGSPCTFEERTGEHNWIFFNQALEKALEFFFPIQET